MKLRNILRPWAFYHAIVWLLLAHLINDLAWFDRPNSKGGILTVVLLGVLAPTIYVHNQLLTRFMERRRYQLYTAATLGVVLAATVLLNFLHEAAGMGIPAADAGTVKGTASFMLGHTAANVGMTLLIATVAHYVRRGLVSHFQMQQLRALQLETELSLLKAQVNQHFLFNTLNNLYGLSLAAPEQMPEALLQLSGLMRYQLDSSREATVTVGTEAEYLANYIGLEKLRLRDNTEVEFTVDLPHPEQPLAPLLLLPLVENCFKHGIGPSGQNTIRIELTQTDAGLTLRTGNSIPPHFRATPSGLGLPTLRARLAQYYPGKRHRLDIKASDAFYAANLQLLL